MDVDFKSFINYDKRLGKMLIWGKEGTGKTLLLTRIAIGKMLHGFYDCKKSHAQTREYNSMGYNFSTNYEHCCFANFDINCKGTEMFNRRVYHLNPFRLGLYRDNYDTDLYPPYSLLCLTEGKNYIDSYMFNHFDMSYIAYLKTGRQADIDMVIDSQYFNDIATFFRHICNRFIYLHKECEEIKDDHGNVIGHKLFVVEWEDDRDVEVFEKTSRKQNCLEYTLIIDMCVYQNYDSKYCRFLHLKGRENQDYNIQYFPDIKSVDEVEQFSDDFGFTAPPGFYKSRTIDKSKTEKLGNVEDEIFEF